MAWAWPEYASFLEPERRTLLKHSMLVKSRTELVWKLSLSSNDLRIGSRGRARTYNPPVNSRLLYH